MRIDGIEYTEVLEITDYQVMCSNAGSILAVQLLQLIQTVTMYLLIVCPDIIQVKKTLNNRPRCSGGFKNI